MAPEALILPEAAGLAFTVAVAAASHYAIERPALSLEHLVPVGSRAAAGEAIAEPAPAALAPALAAGGGPGEGSPA